MSAATSSTARTSVPLATITVRKRDGRLVEFDPVRIAAAMEKAFRAEIALAALLPLPDALQSQLHALMHEILDWCQQHRDLSVESIQDQVERTLMRSGEHRVARRYVLYREAQAQRRRGQRIIYHQQGEIATPLDTSALLLRLRNACSGLVDLREAETLLEQLLASLPTHASDDDITQAALLAVRTQVEFEPAFTYVAARLLLDRMDVEVLGAMPADRGQAYRDYFPNYIAQGIAAGQLAPELANFDLARLASELVVDRDRQFAFLGLQTLYDRYFLQILQRRVELPQVFWMRVAMGLALGEADKEAAAIEFYHLLSQFLFMSATPTLFNSGTRHPQLSSCYLSTVDDDLDHIFKSIKDNALLSKWAGGLGNDWTNIRALGAHIHGTAGKSQGVIPFLKVVSDAAVAVNQGGKRKGAVCAYLETWHLDLEEFLELRKNAGDDRRRTHDLHTANWIPDLFMRRVLDGADWTLFSPDDVPDLHHLFGQAFEARYTHYEAMAAAGEIKLHRRVRAVDLWRKMLSMLFETGHPWITWKDPSNVRSPQDHVGVVHNSNLCTEILLNNSAEETAVCNLGSVNLAAHITAGELDLARLERTIRTAVRMLDNVIDLNFYPTMEAKTANLRHRPIGLGLMGFQDALYAMRLSYASDDAVEFADRSMEAISYYALTASSELARERGKYPTFTGSKWDRGLLPIDTLDLLEQERGKAIEVSRAERLDWSRLREEIRQHGLRNSNVMAIAPTATISNIVGVSQSIEPTYRNLYVKSNLSGEFTQVNTFLVEELKSLGLWSRELLEQLKYYDGHLSDIDSLPVEIQQRYRTAFEIEPRWLIECAARRQKWLDMGQSLNLYLADPSGKKLHDMYFLAWNKGLKTTYYLRTLSATQVEKSTIDVNRFGIQPRWMKNRSASGDISVDRVEPASATCNLDGDCEACQ
ncbi:MAG TPA: ribonucleoside-diphosphate reductase subunit alpha [Pirellulaceae bacterium]|nr:ribonucleoside-diphosphate reductase subunit alpha [Pirellulaceae bacterium]